MGPLGYPLRHLTELYNRLGCQRFYVVILCLLISDIEHSGTWELATEEVHQAPLKSLCRKMIHEGHLMNIVI